MTDHGTSCHMQGTGAVSAAPPMVTTLIGGRDMPKGTCSIEGCERRGAQRGWCAAHYQRWRNTGDTRADVPIQGKASGRLCGIEGCGGAHRARGLCSTHHGRWRKTGDPMAAVPVRPLGRSAALRVLDRVHLEGRCWLYPQVDHLGYGVVKAQGRKNFKAHRVVYEALVGSIPAGLQLDHLCAVRNCVNPDHLEPVDHAENVRRSWARRKEELVPSRRLIP